MYLIFLLASSLSKDEERETPFQYFHTQYQLIAFKNARSRSLFDFFHVLMILQITEQSQENIKKITNHKFSEKKPHKDMFFNI